MNISITPRDTAIILMVHRYDRVGYDLLARAFFTRQKTCEDRVRKLVNAGFLKDIRLYPTSVMGSGKYLFDLGPLGKQHLAEIYGDALSFPRTKVIRSGEKGLHHDAICHFR